MSTKKSKDKNVKTSQQKRDRNGRFASKSGKKSAKKRVRYNSDCAECKQYGACHNDGRVQCGVDFGEGEGESWAYCCETVSTGGDGSGNACVPFDPKGHCLNKPKLNIKSATQLVATDPKTEEIERLKMENRILAEETRVMNSRMVHYRNRKNSYKALANLMRFLIKAKDDRIERERKAARVKCLWTAAAALLGCLVAQVAYAAFTLYVR